jgi:hypothetical protein
MVNFASMDWAFHKRNTDNALGLEISMEMDIGNFKEIARGIPTAHERSVKKTEKPCISYHFAFSEGRYHRQELRAQKHVLFRSEEKPIKHEIDVWFSKGVVFFPSYKEIKQPVETSYNYFLSDRNFYNQFFSANLSKEKESYQQYILSCRAFMKYLKSSLYNMIFYLSSLRTPANSPSSNIPSDDRPSSVGLRGEKTISTLAVIFGPQGKPAVKGNILKWAKRFGLESFNAGSIQGEQGSASVDAGFIDPDMKVSLNLALAGFGSQQMIPVIAQVFCAPPQSMVMVEEPETSLHPGGQILLPDLFVDALENGVQLLISTHSQLLISALRHAVKKKKIKHDQIALYDMKKEKSGCKAIRTEIDSNGTIKGWIPSFAKVEDRMFKEWGRE